MGELEITMYTGLELGLEREPGNLQYTDEITQGKYTEQEKRA